MHTPIIKVCGLSKQYHIGLQERANRTFREAVTDTFTAPIRNLRNLRRLTQVDQDESPDVIWALKGVSFEVQPGEVVGIIGSNGAGKSTLLKIISRITEPSLGEIRLYGRVASLLEVGTGFHPELTGRENIYLNGTLLGMRKAEIDRKFDEIVAFSEIDKFLDTPVKRYSSGMYVRLAFAVAAHLEPEILLVDEVLAVGDASFQKKCLGKISEVGMQGRTILFVSHNMSAIQALCSRSLWIDQGMVAMEGPSPVVVSSYVNQGQSTSGQRIWPEKGRPGGRSFRLISTTLRNSCGEVISSVKISEAFSLEIDYEVIRPGARVMFSLHLRDESENHIFSSLSNPPENEYHDAPLNPGCYRSTCWLPGNLLNDRRYHIALKGLSDGWTTEFFEEHVLSFDGIDDGILKRDYYGSLGGMLRPALSWRTTPLLSDD